MVNLENEGRQMPRDLEKPDNNLEKMIQLSNMKKGEFAEAVGHAPGTISKYINGEIVIPNRELTKFAKVLNCSAMEIMFKQPPMPLLAVNRANFRYIYDPEHANSEYKKLLDQQKMRVVWRFAADYNAKYRNKVVYMDHSFDPNVMCALWDLDVNHPDSPDEFLDYAWLDGAIELVDFTGMIENRIDQNAINHHSYCMTEDNVLHYGVLYKKVPNARTWSVHSRLFTEQHNLNVRWACPALGLITRPELRNIRFETVENQTSKMLEGIDKQNFHSSRGLLTKFKG